MPGDIGRPSPELCRAVESVAELAQKRLEKVDVASIPKPARAAALCALQARTHLKRLKRAGFDPFDPRLGIPATRPLALADARPTDDDHQRARHPASRQGGECLGLRRRRHLLPDYHGQHR